MKGRRRNKGFTLVEVLSTFLYALILYRQKITFGHIFLAKLSVNVLANMGLQSWVMSVVYGKAFYVYVVPRIIKNIVLLPFEVIILSVIFGALILPLVRLHVYHPTQNALVMKKSSYIILGAVAVVMLILAIIAAVNYEAVKDAFKAFMDSIFGK